LKRVHRVNSYSEINVKYLRDKLKIKLLLFRQLSLF
jgi:hypothetical protein